MVPSEQYSPCFLIIDGIRDSDKWEKLHSRAYFVTKGVATQEEGGGGIDVNDVNDGIRTVRYLGMFYMY